MIGDYFLMLTTKRKFIQLEKCPGFADDSGPLNFPDLAHTITCLDITKTDLDPGAIGAIGVVMVCPHDAASSIFFVKLINYA